MDRNQTLLTDLSSFESKLLPITISVSEWQEQRRFIKPGAEKFYELYDFNKAPYLRWLCDLMSPHSPCRALNICKGVRQGVTTGVIMGSQFYNIDVNPTEMMYVSADQSLIDKFLRITFKPSLRQSGLDSKIKPIYSNEKNKNKSTGETGALMEFSGGGYIAFCGANNPNNFRQLPVVYLYLDESATYKVFKDEGWAGDVAKGRLKDAGDMGKLCQVSTPTVFGTGFEKDFTAGNYFEWQMPCPRCGVSQYFDLGKTHKINGKREVEYGCVFKYDDQYRRVGDVEYMCKHCGEIFTEKSKYDINIAGHWESKDPLNLTNVSAQINSFSSNFFSWNDIVDEFLKAKKTGMPSELQIFTNLYEGKFFRYKTTSIDADQIANRPSGYSSGQVPEDVAILTVALDVQGDRVEAEVKGWGHRWHNWSIDYLIFSGDTERNDVWNELEEWVLHGSSYAGLRPIRMVIDSGDGKMMKKAYEFCQRVNAIYSKEMKLDKSIGIIYPLKGQSPTQIHGSRYKKVELPNNIWRLNINTYVFKELVIESIKYKKADYIDPLTKKRRIEIPDNYCEFPNDYPNKYYKQLTSEKLEQNQNPNGFEQRVWKSNGRRNEAFDLFGYNWCIMEYEMENTLIPILQRSVQNLEEKKEITSVDVFSYFLKLRNKNKKLKT